MPRIGDRQEGGAVGARRGLIETRGQALAQGFVRSWSVKTRGWYRAFLTDPRGFIQSGDRTIPVLAVRIRTGRLRDAVDRAYLEKYATPGALKYAKDLGSPKSRATTIELRPATGSRLTSA